MDGEDVDWFAALKYPANVDERRGRSFVYFDSSQKGWKLSPQPINSTESAIGATVNQIYGMDKTRMFGIAYNDDVPGTHVNGDRGHSKGVALFDESVGFWMLHSVPNYPPPGTAPVLEDVVSKKSLKRSDAVYTTIRGIETLGGRKVKGFSKHKKFQLDLWHDFIALNLHTDMAVETWRNGAAKDVGSQCGGGANVYDVNNIALLGRSFSSSKDHSKWGVSMSEKVPAVCIGDVNRQESQFKRGGGAVCIEDRTLWKTFRESVTDFDGCDVSSKTDDKKAPKSIKEDKKTKKSNKSE
ncbi:deoxyribonuclease II [Ancylostoma duodenale]|uniref:Deoxyribonuclease II n=1 Tax=Ancylostoma duodenale TaxID=51022 RepID=A0A0C2G7U8_9BILA|nr:deoxyribonuclease II [Ancylostoma duodenale]